MKIELKESVNTPSKLTIVLPEEEYVRLVTLAKERTAARTGSIIHTNAIAGEQHPLHTSGRGVR